MKEIVGWPGYCITEDGDAISFKGKTPKVLKQGKDGGGYLKVNLFKDGKQCTRNLHRLVAEAFIPNPLGLPEVNHKDENPKNNHVENLEWCTHKENINYGTRTERSSKTQRNDPTKSKPVIAYTYEDGENYGEYPSVSEAARQLGVNQGHISECCNGKRKHAGGFVFTYK